MQENEVHYLFAKLILITSHTLARRILTCNPLRPKTGDLPGLSGDFTGYLAVKVQCNIDSAPSAWVLLAKYSQKLGKARADPLSLRSVYFNIALSLGTGLIDRV